MGLKPGGGAPEKKKEKEKEKNYLFIGRKAVQG